MRDKEFAKPPKDDGLPCPYTDAEQEGLVVDVLRILQECTLSQSQATVRALVLAAALVSRLSGAAPGSIVVTANNILPLVDVVLRTLRGTRKQQVDCQAPPAV